MKKIAYILILLPLIITASVQAQSAKQYLKTGEDFAKANNYVRMPLSSLTKLWSWSLTMIRLMYSGP